MPLSNRELAARQGEALRARHTRICDLRPSCSCYAVTHDGSHVLGCEHQNWMPPPVLELPCLPTSVQDCHRLYVEADNTFKAALDRSCKDAGVALEIMIRTQEALLLWLARYLVEIPGQPNQLHHYLLCSIEFMLRVYDHYKVQVNQKKGIKAAKKRAANYGWKYEGPTRPRKV